MAQHRRSPQNRVPSSSLTSPSARRKYALRRSQPIRRRAAVALRVSSSSSHTSRASSVSTTPDPRPVLVPLHPNLRRLPSRLLLAQKVSDMRDASHGVQVGSKRKRVVSANDHAHGGRPTRGSGRPKRLRSASGRQREYSTDDESGSSSMEIDTTAQWSASEDSALEDPEEPNQPDEDEESTDDHLIHSAQPRQLQRLRKDELVRLFNLVGLAEDVEPLTKSDIIEAIVAARDDLASLPPSSPLGRGGDNSSDYSSDDGNVAGDEETDFGGPRYPAGASVALRRRATFNELGKANGRSLKGRSLSLGLVLNNQHQHRDAGAALGPKGKAGEGSGNNVHRRRTSNRSSPSTTSSKTSTLVQSPPVTRFRTRKASATTDVTTTLVSGRSPLSNADTKGAMNNNKSKGKGKQVEFSADVTIKQHKTPSKRSSREKEKERERAQERARVLDGEESELTELEELEQSLCVVQGEPSPRRLRSKDKAKEGGGAIPEAEPSKHARRVGEEWDAGRRVTLRRKAKTNIGSLAESDQEELSLEEEMDQEEGEEEDEEDELVDEDGEDLEDVADEEEVDELVSSASATPLPFKGRRTPVKRRLRPRGRVDAAPSDGDDEDEDDEIQDGDEELEEEEADEGDVDGEGEEDLDSLDTEEEGEEADDDDETITVEPRRLRNGKVVGEEDVEMETAEEDVGEEDVGEEDVGEEDVGEEDAGEEGGEEGEEEVEVEGLEEDESIDVDAEGDTDEDEPMEDDVDLTVATAKTLVRLRRDDLVRLCETRDLEPVGTKPQLAEALLQWRDRQANDFSSPSSTGTVRPPSTMRRRPGRRHTHSHSESSNKSPPVLMRSDRVHQDEPRTPPEVSQTRGTQGEPELELDLESLGLEDREIPPEKLQKLEKIGSGGFKDVFIGKFKGRKIAISEFRGQLSAMDIKELKLLGGFDHPNIVRFLGVSIPENTRETPVMIVSELCSNGDLFDYVRNVNPPSLYKVLTMMLDIARGLEYLHQRKPSVIHRDCKSSNILITAKGTAKIADFGLAKVKQSTRSMVRSLVGTVNWQAPELWHAHPKYNHKVDVFSCALVFWEMLQWHLPNKKFPWEGMNEHAIYEIVGSKRQRPSLSGLRKQWCPEIVEFIERMWAQEHQDRPTMSQVVEALEGMVAHRR